MKNFLILLLFCCLAAPALCENDPLPFPVNLGEQEATRIESTNNHALIENPVSADAQLSVKDVEGQIIVNVFPSDENGNPKNGAQPLILLFDASSSKALSANMQGKAPEAGWYLANVVGGGNTSRIVFKVE